MTDIKALPPLFINRMQRLLGEEWEAFAASYSRPYPTGLRVNTLKITPQDFQSLSPYSLSPLPWCPEGFSLARDESFPIPPGKHPLHAVGLYYIQEPSAMAVATVLDPQPGERILDLSAAPGGKSTHIAARLQRQGVLVANEVHTGRVWELAENLERWGAANAVILNETSSRLADAMPGWFDRVLLDAPCSGEGMFRKSQSALRDWSPNGVAACAARQEQILAQAARLVRPGGVLVYSTCTFAPRENEGVISQFLDSHPEFELEPVPALPGFSPARPDWTDAGQKHSLQYAVRIWPHMAPGEGHFFARLQRAGNPYQPAKIRLSRITPVPAESQKLFDRFCQESLSGHFDPARVHQVGSYLYEIPQNLKMPTGLKSLHPGRWLGLIKPGRFEPAHALALSLLPGQALNTVTLDKEQVWSYLRGETLQHDGPDGWTLVTYQGYALGWGKRVGKVIKNWLPKGLRKPVG